MSKSNAITTLKYWILEGQRFGIKPDVSDLAAIVEELEDTTEPGGPSMTTPGYVMDRMLDDSPRIGERVAALEKAVFKQVVISQEYRPKCDWCGNYLKGGAIKGDDNAVYCSVACSTMHKDHKKIIALEQEVKELTTWQDEIESSIALTQKERDVRIERRLNGLIP